MRKKKVPEPIERPPLPPINRKDTDCDHYTVAVWWPDGDYGCGKSYPTLAEARRAAVDDIRLGYGDGIKSRVHVIRVQRKLVGVIDNKEWKELK